MKTIISTIRLGTIISIMALMAQSCISSLHPLYTEDDLVFDRNLIGTWIDKDSNEYKIDVRKPKKNIKPDSISYILTYEEGKPADFLLHLLKLEKYHYVDIEMKSYETENSMVDLHIFPVHTFAKIKVEKDSIILQTFNFQFITKLLKENKIKIKCEIPNENLILTGSPEEMQKFIIKYADHKDLYDKPSTLKRKE